MTRLTELMRTTLENAARQDGLRRTHDDKPGRPPWPMPHQSLNALVNRGLLAHTRTRNRKGYPLDIWRITDTGREALKPPQRISRDTHNSMAAKGAATTRVLVGGVWQHLKFPEPEKVTTPGPGWVRRGRNLHADAQDRRQRAYRAKAA